MIFASSHGTLAAWVHNMDPYMIRLWEGGPIRWYGMSYLVGFFVGWLIARRVVRVGQQRPDTLETPRLAPMAVTDLVVMVAFGAVIGGRLGYCAFYQPSLFTTFDGSFPWWGVFKLNEGGMASHGGIIGAALAAMLFARHHKQPFAYILDLTAFGAPLGLLFGRLANFVNGELYGRPCAEDFPLAVKFPQELTQGFLSADQGERAEQLQALTPAVEALGIPIAAWQDIQFGMMMGEPGSAQRLTDVLHQLVLATQNGQTLVVSALEPVLQARHPSQLYAGLTEGVIVMLVLVVAWARPRKPLTIGGLFCVTYAIMRVFNERFRLPDEQFFAADGSLPLITHGQKLSLGIFALGVITLIYARRTALPPMGGWRVVADNTDEAKRQP